jgi:hypothetical protein
MNIERLNYPIITIIPKEEEAKTLKKFRSINRINYNFKVFAKPLNNRLELVCDRLLSYNQTTFIKCRFIFESVVAAQDIIYDVVKRGTKDMMLKLDYEKSYNRVSWAFLEEMLVTRGFGPRWRGWILKLVKGGSIAIRLNDANSQWWPPSF